MKNQRLLVALTVLNLALLTFQVVRPRIALAQEPAQVLRGRALEIVDDHGKVRAELRVFPPDPKHKLPNGDPYPETVLLRLIAPNGRPSVKLATDLRGGGLYLGGAEDPTMVKLGADGAEVELKLVNKDRTEKIVKPGCCYTGPPAVSWTREDPAMRHSILVGLIALQM